MYLDMRLVEGDCPWCFRDRGLASRTNSADPKRAHREERGIKQVSRDKTGKVKPRQGNKGARHIQEKTELQVIKMGTRGTDHSRTRNSAYRASIEKESRNREAVDITSEREIKTRGSTR